MGDRAEPIVESGASRKSRIPVGGVVLGLGILVGGISGFLLARNSPREAAPPQPPIVTRAERVSTERQIASRRLTDFKVEAFSPFIDPVTVVDGFEPPLVLGPPYEAVNSATFDTASLRVRLGRVRAVGRSEVCYDANQMRFACGLMGRAALKNLLGQRMVICDRLFLPGFAGDGAVAAECRTDTNWHVRSVPPNRPREIFGQVLRRIRYRMGLLVTGQDGGRHNPLTVPRYSP